MAQSLAGDGMHGMPMKMKIITPETSRNLLHIFASITSCWRWVNLFGRLAVAFLCHFCEQLFGSMWYSELRFSKPLRDHNQILPCHSVFLYVPLYCMQQHMSILSIFIFLVMYISPISQSSFQSFHVFLLFLFCFSFVCLLAAFFA